MHWHQANLSWEISQQLLWKKANFCRVRLVSLLGLKLLNFFYPELIFTTVTSSKTLPHQPATINVAAQ